MAGHRLNAKFAMSGISSRERAIPKTDFLVARGIPIAVTRCGYLKKTAIMPPVSNKRAAQIEPRRVAL